MNSSAYPLSSVSDSDESDHEREEVDKASQKIVEGDPEERKRFRAYPSFQRSSLTFTL